MPIRPEISLQTAQAPQVDPISGIERGMKLQQLAMQPALLEQQMSTARQAEATSRAAQMTSEAQLPGVAATAAGQVRGERQANERITAAQNAFDLDDKGNPVIDPQTGQPKFNLNKYQYGLHKAGLVDEAFKVAGTALKQSTDVYNFTAGVRNDVAIAAQAAYDRTPGSPAAKQKAAEATWADLSGRAVAASQQGQFPLNQDQFKYTPGLEKALYTASINPQAQEVLKQGIAGQDIQRAQLGLQVEQFNNSKLTNFTDDASLDPNSQASIMARQIAKDVGMKIDDNMSAGDIHRNDLTKSVLSSVGAAAGAAKKEADKVVNQYESASSALENAKDVLAKNKITPLNLLQNKFNTKLLDDPKLLALYGQIQQLPDKSVINEGMDYNAVKAVLDGLSVNAKANAVSAVGGSPAKPTAPTTPNAANVTKIKSNEEYRALPSGTVFTGPDGIRRTKP
jgi:hypothetical protein